MLLLMFIFAITMVLFQAVTPGVSVAQGIALTIAGLVAPFITQLIKNAIGTGGAKAMLLACAISAVIAIIASFIAGDWHTFGDLVKNAMVVFGIATAVFHLLIGQNQTSS